MVEVEYINQLNQNCQKCPILVKSRKRVTWGYGNVKSPVVFIGEAPGYLGCDITGIPFRGDRSGNLYEKMLNTIGFTTEDVYTTNVVKCCPPGNRDPLPEEISNCKSYLRNEIEAIEPVLIVPMGKFAAKIFYPYIDSILKIWDKQLTLSIGQILILPHPAYICRRQDKEARYISSFKRIKKLISV